ncbi:MAG: EAL domain-containing protein [Steroidobacterales bacterium]|jgi:diguanylate cyclase (GGDEF)-like protein
MTDLLNSLAEQLQCAHVAVHAPIWNAELIVPAPAHSVAHDIRSLTRELLWWMAHERADARMLNRMRLKSGGPIVPFRALLCPLRDEGSTVGLVAALRSRQQPAFETADLSALSDAAPWLQEQLRVSAQGQRGIARWSALDLEVIQRFRDGEPTCVVYADLDHIHAVNEAAGLAAGDGVLQEIARLWQGRLLPEDCIAGHLGGDRYAAVLFGHTINQARSWSDRVRKALAGLDLPGTAGHITASLGLAALTDRDSLSTALAAAETACRVAKERGRDRLETYATGDTTIMRRSAEVGESRLMMDAIDTGRLVLHAQPIVALATPAQPTRFEILLRVRDHDGQLISISEYLGAADRYQLLERLDRWVVESVLKLIKPHAQQLLAQAIRFSVNLTGQSLAERTFTDFVRTTVKQQAVPADLLIFEVTEGAALRNLAATRRFIDRMTELGASVALDDFGTGVSSLMHLKELAVQQIKIDGRFVRDIVLDSRSDALVRALVLIADRLGLHTVAEHVESEAVADHLRSIGVRYGQGYLYGHPQPLTDTLTALLHGSSPVPAAHAPLVKIA